MLKMPLWSDENTKTRAIGQPVRIALVGRRGQRPRGIPTSRDGRRQPYRERRRWFLPFSSSSSPPSSSSLFFFFLAFSKVFGRGGAIGANHRNVAVLTAEQAEEQHHSPSGERARRACIGWRRCCWSDRPSPCRRDIYEAEVVGSVLIVSRRRCAGHPGRRTRGLWRAA